MGYLETQFLRGLFFLVRLCGERGELVGKHCKHSKCTLPHIHLPLALQAPAGEKLQEESKAVLYWNLQG